MIYADVTSDGGSSHLFGHTLIGISRCPHCGIADPNLAKVWASKGPTARTDGGVRTNWGAFCCSSCGAVVTAQGSEGLHKDKRVFLIDAVYPPPKSVHADVPEPAHTFLRQAIETLHAPDAAAVMAGSAVDAMLKAKGLEKGTLYERIDLALKQNILTDGMANWAHSVRLGSNRPRHADKEKPHVSPDEAKQSVEFAEALGQFLFVLTARIERGIEAAEKAG